MTGTKKKSNFGKKWCSPPLLKNLNIQLFSDFLFFSSVISFRFTILFFNFYVKLN